MQITDIPTIILALAFIGAITIIMFVFMVIGGAITRWHEKRLMKMTGGDLSSLPTLKRDMNNWWEGK